MHENKMIESDVEVVEAEAGIQEVESGVQGVKPKFIRGMDFGIIKCW